MGILQNQTSGLLQLILYKRHSKVVGDTLFFERLTQGVTEEAHALGYDLSVRYFYGSQPGDKQIRAIQSEPSEAFLRFGYRIPQDVSVIGFDDSSISTTRTPPLTTMQVQKQRFGALAVDRLHTRLQKDVPETQTLKQKEYVEPKRQFAAFMGASRTARFVVCPRAPYRVGNREYLWHVLLFL